MTVYTGPMFNWRTSGLDWDAPPYESSSPNLVLIAEYMRNRFGGGSMGIHFDKKTSNGVISEHSWGAADDWGTGQSQVDWLKRVGRPTGRALSRSEHFAAVDWIVAHSAELHIQSIVDIGRSWRADRVKNGASGWKDYNSRYTGHCHIVTTLDGWGDTTPIERRLSGNPGSPNVPVRRADMLDISSYQTIMKWAQVPEVPIVHRCVVKEDALDSRWNSRMPVISKRTKLFGGYVVLAPGKVRSQVDRYAEAMRPYWRDGAFTQLDVERWSGVGLITPAELDEAIARHAHHFGPDRVIVYMNPFTTPDLWKHFVAQHPTIPRWVPGYRPDDDVKAKNHDATVHQWTDNFRPSGFTGPVDANEIRNLPELNRVANLGQSTNPPEEDDMLFRYRHTKYADQFVVGAGAIKLTPTAVKLPQYAALPLVENADDDFLGNVLLAAQFSFANLTPMSG